LYSFLSLAVTKVESIISSGVSYKVIILLLKQEQILKTIFLTSVYLQNRVLKQVDFLLNNVMKMTINKHFIMKMTIKKHFIMKISKGLYLCIKVC